MGQHRPLFLLFSVFSNKQYNVMSIQYTAPGFEHTTFGTWVSYHKTRASVNNVGMICSSFVFSQLKANYKVLLLVYNISSCDVTFVSYTLKFELISKWSLFYWLQTVCWGTLHPRNYPLRYIHHRLTFTRLYTPARPRQLHISCDSCLAHWAYEIEWYEILDFVISNLNATNISSTYKKR